MDIDIAVTWVDGNDPDWQADMRRYAVPGAAGSEEYRFRDWDNLRYLFRGIEAFAPWVRHVHFITCGHLPSWLNTGHPKLRTVRHEDYIPAEYLPTFSSHPIELNMHRIEGLSENFIYFNDDVFLGKPVREQDFFQNGLPRDVAVISAVAPKEDFSYIVLNNVNVINRHFQKQAVLRGQWRKWINLKYGVQLFRTFALFPWRNFTGFLDPHLAMPLRKQTLRELWTLEPDVMHAACTHKFRSAADVSIWLARYWQLAKGEFIPARYADGNRHWINSPAAAAAAARDIAGRKHKLLCLNDEISAADFDCVKQTLRTAFEELLPTRSAFEH